MNMKQKKITGATLGLAVLALIGRAYGYDEIVVKDGATIRGSVKLEGAAPKLAPLQITKYKEICKDVPNETLILGPNRGVRYAVITLEGIGKGKAVEKEVVHELDNVKCRFTPHVQAASVGQFVQLKNSDPILHTAHARFTGNQPEFNVGLYPGRVSRKPLIAPGLVRIQCEVHPWMSAYIVVTDHPYYAVTDKDGSFKISNVPAGNYTVEAFHLKAGSKTEKVTVGASDSKTVSFELMAPQ